jgi:LuxR family maltose regulon positive regulatory protein
MLASGQRAVELETDGSTPWFAAAHFSLGHALYVAGDLEAAATVLPKAAYSTAGATIIRSFAFSLMALVERELGHPDRSREYAVKAMSLVEAPSMRVLPQASMAITALGESQAAAGELAAAIVTLEEGLVLRRKIPGLSPWPTIYHLLVMGRVLAAAGDLLRAEQLVEEAGQLMSRFPDGMEAMRDRLAAARSDIRRRRSPKPGLEPLTRREADVLRLLQSSMNLTEIAAQLYLSRNTVKTHAQAVYRKLGARSRSEAVLIGRRHSLI